MEQMDFMDYGFVYDMQYRFYVWTVLVCDELCMDLDYMNLMCGLQYMCSYHAHFQCPIVCYVNL